MAKKIIIDGCHYRVRRGKLVQIPDKWIGSVPHKQTIRKRPSKSLHKFRKQIKHREFSS